MKKIIETANNFDKLTNEEIKNNNKYTKHIIEFYMILARDLEDDPDLRKRKYKQLCSLCYYKGNGLVGRGFTNSSCRTCNESLTFSNTNVDELCDPCAKKYQLCKHCSSDIDYMDRRKNPRLKELK